MIVRAHWGQHDPDVCFGCKLTTLSFSDGTPKKHQHKGDPWDGNPVQERILELQAEGRRVQTMELSQDGTVTERLPQ